MREMPADEGGRGNIKGYEHTCSQCGLVMRNSIKSNLEADVREHAAHHNKRSGGDAYRAGQAYAAKHPNMSAAEHRRRFPY